MPLDSRPSAAALALALGLAGAAILPASSLPRPLQASPDAQAAVDLEVPTGETIVLSGTHRFDEVLVRSGATLKVDDYEGRPPDGGEPGGSLEILARRIVVEAGGQISATGAGFRGLPMAKGEGPGGGQGGIDSLHGRWAAALGPQAGSASDGSFASGPGFWTSVDPAPEPEGVLAPLHPTSSGAGGGYGGRGGDGAQDDRRGAWKGGRSYGAEDPIQLGSGGGAAPPSHHETDSLEGGDGGGALILRAEEIRIDGSIHSNGEAGADAEYDAGGGGSGGGIQIEAEDLEIRGSVLAIGGRNGRATVLGGAGGGGRIRIRWASGSLDRSRIAAGPGNGPCPPSGEASFRSCPGSIDLEYTGGRSLYLPLLMRGVCIGPNRKAIALVMDASSSMQQSTRDGRPAIAAAVEAAAAFLDQLGDEDRAALISFDHEARVLAPLGTDLAGLRAGLGRIQTASGSRLDLGLQRGAESLAPALPGERRILVLLTDGQPSRVEADEVRAAAATLRLAGVRIYAIGIGPQIDRSLLVDIAGEAGRVLIESDAEGLHALYQDIAMREGCPLP